MYPCDLRFMLQLQAWWGRVSDVRFLRLRRFVVLAVWVVGCPNSSLCHNSLCAIIARRLYPPGNPPAKTPPPSIRNSQKFPHITLKSKNADARQNPRSKPSERNTLSDTARRAYCTSRVRIAQTYARLGDGKVSLCDRCGFAAVNWTSGAQ